ncbi:helix-turn-helix domain-containing protein [Pseudomonas sp. S60]|uniref:LexA family protein n=1 Tax=unclassified Pseudomonas TaxID=196821 RepID=UPI001914C9C8|nr:MULTISPECIES: S24 family peptidase [unclassified Pseudomonas]MBK4987741.1 helix-turn-helix domain-containing protein [Pseudomonas sp. S36]MBK5007044.1 helix-turn-helix domain-containing protein [Pseudomonas sp. S32]MBK5012018.1 helix-turn-helix domain-containing protein [Pseudomonas sp. S60]
MENWNAFLKRYKREHNLSQLKLAERLGMTQGGVGHWLRGTRRPTLETINEKLEKLGLIYLEAQVMVVERDIVRETSPHYGPARPISPQALLYASFRFPVLAWADLQGPLPDASEVHEQTDYMPAGNAFWLAVENDSMNATSGQSVPEGMRVLVDTGLDAKPGNLVIARQPGRPAVLRQLVEEGGDKMLRPLNARYPTVLCEDGCEFLGVVVRVHGSF